MSQPRLSEIRLSEVRRGLSVRRLSPRRRLGAGLVLIAVALVAAALGRGMAGREHHAYDPNAVPLSSYQLSIGRTYQLSASGGVRALQSSGLLDGVDPTCFAASVSAAGGAGQPVPLALSSTKDDPRDLHVFATFQISASGRYVITCNLLDKVFIDDADNSEPGYSTALVLLAALAGALGVGCALSGVADVGSFGGAAAPEN
jgi:hypothetical protein